MRPLDPTDWNACVTSLEAVSRTFSRPIALLDTPLRQAVTVGYLLCRVADTIEDRPALPLPLRSVLFDELLRVLDGAPSDRLRALFPAPASSDAEAALLHDIDRVLRVLDTLPASLATIVRRWVAEMTRGMALYAHRDPAEDGIVQLRSSDDLVRYCYYVAGTVGHLLTDLFVASLPSLGSDAAWQLREDAEAFGIGLQYVNILKDVTDDLERGWCFVPATTTRGRSLRDAKDARSHEEFEGWHRALDPLFAQARANLDRGLRYTLALPASRPDIRLFCLLPLWMAIRTLAVAERNDAIFRPGAPVKIPRAETEAIIALAVQHVAEDAQIRQIAASLHHREATALLRDGTASPTNEAAPSTASPALGRIVTPAITPRVSTCDDRPR